MTTGVRIVSVVGNPRPASRTHGIAHTLADAITAELVAAPATTVDRRPERDPSAAFAGQGARLDQPRDLVDGTALASDATNGSGDSGGPSGGLLDWHVDDDRSRRTPA
jgi:hypothetical protein